MLGFFNLWKTRQPSDTSDAAFKLLSRYMTTAVSGKQRLLSLSLSAMGLAGLTLCCELHWNGTVQYMVRRAPVKQTSILAFK